MSGANAIEFGNNHDVFAYHGPPNTETSFTGYRALVNNTAHWLTEDGAGDQSINGLAPDVPFINEAFSTTSSSPEPSAWLLSITSGLVLLIGHWRTPRQAASLTPMN